MMDQHEDPKFEQWLKGAAKSYHSPRATPREEIWKRIEDARRNKHVIELRPWMRWVVAAAAVLVIGIGIGRWTVHQPSAARVTPVAATETDSTQPDVVYQVAATQYLSRAEAFLTGFRADARADAHSARFASQDDHAAHARLAGREGSADAVAARGSGACARANLTARHRPRPA